MYFYHPHSGRFEQSTRSSVRATTFGPTFPRRAYDDDVLYVPYRPFIPHYAYDTTSTEYASRSDVNRELIMSTAAMNDNFDIATRSRKRDRDVLAAANKAIGKTVVEKSQPGTLPVSAAAGTYVSRRSTSKRAKAPRSTSVPPRRPTYTTTAVVLPLDLKASDTTKPSQYIKYSKVFDNIKAVKSGQYEPMYSNRIRTAFSPLRDLSPFRAESPMSESRNRSLSPYRSLSPTPIETRSRLVKKRQKPPRVLASKRRVGNYYDKLLAKRAKSGKPGKYWPYIDVEDIENESLGDVLSDTEIDTGDTGYRYDYVIKSSGGDDELGDTYEPITYSYHYNPDSDIPDEYVPFRPKPRVPSPERDYSQLSVLPYMPTRDPTKNTVQDDISFNAVVAASAARARKALENINWNDYDSAGLVLSVEGEYKPPSQESFFGFRYVSRPIMLKIPASQRVRASDSDNAFTKYMTDLQKFREGIRERLEDGYKAISRETSSCISPTLPAITSSSYSSTYTRPIRRPHYTSLTEEAGYKHGHSLELYPLSSESRSSRAVTSSRDLFPSSGALKLYEATHGKYETIGTLARIQIKAALLANKVEVSLPRRHPRSNYAQAKMRQLRKERHGEEEFQVASAEVTSGLKAHPPIRLQRPRRIWEKELSYTIYRYPA